jgi:Lactonase, 7-bladed beta-propeller
MSANSVTGPVVICFLIISLSLLTACGTGFTRQSNVQAGNSSQAGNTQSQPGTPATPPSSISTPTPTPSGPEYVYFTYNGKVYGFQLGDDGSLTATPDSPYTVGQGAGDFVLDEAYGLGLAATTSACTGDGCTGGTNAISVFSQAAGTGDMQFLGLHPTGEQLSAIAIDDSGRYLYGSGYYGLKTYSISADGELSQLPDSPNNSLYGNVYKDSSSNRFFTIGFAPDDWQGAYVTAFVPSQSGVPAITSGPFAFKSSGPTAAATDPSGNHLFVFDTAASGNLHVFSIESNISEVVGSPFKVDATGQSIAIDPNGSWLYCNTYNNKGGITQYPINKKTGSVGSEVSFFSLDVNTVAFDKQGQYLIATRLPFIYVLKPDPESGALELVNKTSLF